MRRPATLRRVRWRSGPRCAAGCALFLALRTDAGARGTMTAPVTRRVRPSPARRKRWCATTPPPPYAQAAPSIQGMFPTADVFLRHGAQQLPPGLPPPQLRLRQAARPRRRRPVAGCGDPGRVTASTGPPSTASSAAPTARWRISGCRLTKAERHERLSRVGVVFDRPAASCRGGAFPGGPRAPRLDPRRAPRRSRSPMPCSPASPATAGSTCRETLADDLPRRRSPGFAGKPYAEAAKRCCAR